MAGAFAAPAPEKELLMYTPLRPALVAGTLKLISAAFGLELSACCTSSRVIGPITPVV